MGKREIIAAAKKKGIEFSTVEWSMQSTPGGSTGSWDIVLTEESEWLIGEVDPNFDEYTADMWNSQMAMEWIDSMPDIRDARESQP